MSTIEKAIAIATESHTGQIDKSGQPYILHPLRLMTKFQNENEMIVAVLHDVVEDSNYSLDDLKRLSFSNEILVAIDCLTKRINEAYDDFILRISKNPLTVKIKIEDIKDNLDISRIPSIDEEDLNRIKKYHLALTSLRNIK